MRSDFTQSYFNVYAANIIILLFTYNTILNYITYINDKEVI